MIALTIMIIIFIAGLINLLFEKKIKKLFVSELAYELSIAGIFIGLFILFFITL